MQHDKYNTTGRRRTANEPDDARQDVVVAAFEAAIAAGRLSDDPQADNYAGHYVFMGYSGLGLRGASNALFKHIMTRRYLP